MKHVTNDWFSLYSVALKITHVHFNLVFSFSYFFLFMFLLTLAFYITYLHCFEKYDKNLSNN